MNNIFDLHRASSYAVYTARSGAKKYAITAGAGFVCGLIALFFMMSIGFDLSYVYSNDYACYFGSRVGSYDPLWNQMMTIFWIGLAVAMCVSASLTYNCLNTKEGRISELMVPASHLEKYAVRWIIFLPLTLAVYLAGFCIVELVRILIVHISVSDPIGLMPLWDNPEGPLPLRFLDNNGFPLVVAAQSVFLLGSAIWPKMSVLKTLLAGFILFIVYTLWVVWLADTILIHGMKHDNPCSISPETFIAVSCYTFSIVCYVLAYYRIKEIEIIQRW